MMRSKLFCFLPFVFLVVLQVNSYEWTEIYASDGQSLDYFGRSVGISDELVVVGAYADDDQGSTSGSAYIFGQDISSGNWSQEAKLLAEDGGGADSFGWSVDISGNVVIIGAWKDDDAGSDAGAAYIFTKDSNTGNWEQTTKFVPGDSVGENIRWCGYSVSISGNSAIMGCYYSTSGYAFIYEYTNNEWQQTAVLTGGEYFGFSVAIYDSEYAIIGETRDDTEATNAGAASIYSKDDTTSEWSYTQTLYASNAGASDFFGYSVSICDDYAIVGAIYEDTEADNAGAAYIFKRTVDTWNETQQLTRVDGSASDYFGGSVSLNCDSDNYYAVIGASCDDTVVTNGGAGYLFKLITVDGDEYWNETAQLITDLNVADQFGYSVSASDDCVILGAPYRENDGQAFIICHVLSSIPTSLPTPATTQAVVQKKSVIISNNLISNKHEINNNLLLLILMVIGGFGIIIVCGKNKFVKCQEEDKYHSIGDP